MNLDEEGQPMKTYTVTGGGGVKSRVDETGNTNGKPLLFIHGFAQCRLSWNKQLHSDLEKDFRLVAMDLRGHGLSEKPRDAYGDSRLWADDVNAVITTLGLHKPVLSGWSYGGVVICDYVRFYGEEQIGGVHFVGAAAMLGPKLMPFVGKEFASGQEKMFSTDVEESVMATQRFVRLCVYEEPTPEDLYFFLGFNMLVPPHVRTAALGRSLDNDDLLPTLRKPVLITHGEKDDVVDLAMAKYIAARVPHAQTSYYPNIGHAPFWEDAERFNRELQAFATSL
jgi:pimeloyl-ACP methyl ester carboxylesterase